MSEKHLAQPSVESAAKTKEEIIKTQTIEQLSRKIEDAVTTEVERGEIGRSFSLNSSLSDYAGELDPGDATKDITISEIKLGIYSILETLKNRTTPKEILSVVGHRIVKKAEQYAVIKNDIPTSCHELHDIGLEFLLISAEYYEIAGDFSAANYFYEPAGLDEKANEMLTLHEQGVEKPRGRTKESDFGTVYGKVIDRVTKLKDKYTSQPFMTQDEAKLLVTDLATKVRELIKRVQSA
jgi:hypothetical protein